MTVTPPSTRSPAPPIPVIDLAPYRIDFPDHLATPALVVYPDLVIQNIGQAIAWAGGDPSRLRPHVKTHKTREIAQLELDLGITKHKAATLVEAELLASVGAKEILIAYPMVGPNPERLARIIMAFPHTRFQVDVDDEEGARRLGNACRSNGVKVDVVIDLDGGMGRTGIPIGPLAHQLAEAVARNDALRLAGVHLYDGDVDDPDPRSRRRTIDRTGAELHDWIEESQAAGRPIERIIAGGTGSFHLWLDWGKNDPRVEASPGTFVLSDWNYHARFADARMVPAAVLLTRVISKPRAGRLTFDLGHKAVASDPAAAMRVHFLDFAQWTFVRHSEEHLVIDTPEADRYRPGDLCYALPYHICPTVALYPELLVVQGGEVVGKWSVAARHREIHV